MTTYLCTTGTSIATRLKLSLEHFAKYRLSDWDVVQKEVEHAWDFVLERVQSYVPNDYAKAGAEVNSLVKMGLQPDDLVVLLATETVEGKLCAQLVEKYLELKGLCNNVEVQIVEGLQAQDGERFRRVGIRNLMSILCRYETEDVVINPTAGFKSVVPYLTLAGMLFRKPVKYIHEYSDEVVTLVNLPISFDEDLMFMVEDKLKTIEKETSIPIKKWRADLKHYGHGADALVEEDDLTGEVTLSGLGLLLWERFKRDFPDNLERTKSEPRTKPLCLYPLLSDNRPACEKKNKLKDAMEHHGMKALRRLAERLLTSPYVNEIVNGCDFQPKDRRWIKPLVGAEAKKHTQNEQLNLCMATLVNTDAGYSMLIRTTARNESENFEIAEILNRKFFS